jgi:hypothetical protein
VTVEVKGEGNRAGGCGAAASALDRAAGLFTDGGQEPGQGCVFGAPLQEPDVVLGHGTAVTFLESGGCAVDQRFSFRQLPF